MRSLIAASKSSSHQFLCLTVGRFFVPTEIPPAPRGTAVNDGRRPPAQPARNVIDGGEHGADPEVGRARPRRTASVLGIVEVVLLIHLPHPCRDHGSLRGRYETASSWV